MNETNSYYQETYYFYENKIYIYHIKFTLSLLIKIIF